MIQLLRQQSIRWANLLPLRYMFFIPYAMLLLLTMSIIGGLSWNHGHVAVNTLAQQLHHAMSVRIQTHLLHHLETPHKVNQAIQDAIDLNWLDTRPSETLQQYFLKQLQLFDQMSYIQLGNEAGEFMGIERHADRTLTVDIANEQTRGDMETYPINAQGQRDEKSISFVPIYDPKRQMWYQNAARTQETHWAIQVGKSNWSEIFSFFGQTWLSVTQSKPLFKNEKLLGVVAIDYTLTDISRFLHELHVSPRGQTFIMERDGKLIATSTQEKLYSLSLIDKKVERLVAHASQSPQIRQTAQFIQQHLPSVSQTQQAVQFDYWLENERQWVKVLPFHNDNLDWLIVVVVPELDFTGEIDKNTRLTIVSASIALLISLLLSLFISHWVIRPIRYLNQAAHHLAQRRWTQLPVERTDELGELAHSFNLMAKQLQELFQHLEAKVQERTYELAQANEEICTLNEYLREENQRMGMELEVTQKLQQMVLPRAEELAQIKPLDIAGFMEPAAEVGGDYYDILQHEGRIKIGIGDVTGHGLESGVLMLMVQTAVRTLLSSQITDPTDFLNILNRTLYDNLQRMQSDKNLTLSLLDYANGSLRISGQHEEVLYVNQLGKIERIDTFNLGFMVGIEPDITQFVAQHEINLADGEGVVLYTDGVTEAMNEAKQCYGLARLCEVVSQHWSLSALEIQQAVIQDLRHHIGKCKLQDDVTLLVIKQRAISFL